MALLIIGFRLNLRTCGSPTVSLRSSQLLLFQSKSRPESDPLVYTLQDNPMVQTHTRIRPLYCIENSGIQVWVHKRKKKVAPVLLAIRPVPNHRGSRNLLLKRFKNSRWESDHFAMSVSFKGPIYSLSYSVHLCFDRSEQNP